MRRALEEKRDDLDSGLIYLDSMITDEEVPDSIGLRGDVIPGMSYKSRIASYRQLLI